MLALEKSLEIINESFDLELARINRDYNYMTQMAEITGMDPAYMMESGEEQNPSAPSKNAIQRIIDAVVKFIRDASASIKAAFARDRMEDVEQYLNSQTGQVQLSYDMEGIEAAVDKQILQGRSIVQKISSATGISDATVAKFADECADVVNKYGSAVVQLGAISAIRKKCADVFLNKTDRRVQNLFHGQEEGYTYTYQYRKKREEVEKKIPKTEKKVKKDINKTIKNARKAGKSDKDIERDLGDIHNAEDYMNYRADMSRAKRQAQQKKVAESIANMVKNAQKAKNTVFSETSKIMNNARAMMNKKKGGQ